jgi:hypothetical protein
MSARRRNLIIGQAYSYEVKDGLVCGRLVGKDGTGGLIKSTYLRFRCQSRLLNGRLEELDGVSRRIFQDDLLTSHTGHDFVAKMHSRLS